MSDAELRRQNRYTWMLIAFSTVAIFFMAQQSRAADRYWSGYGASDNISDGNNWWGNVNPTSGDNLFFNNTAGTRLWVNINYAGNSYFGNLISYQGAGAINITGDQTYLYTFENNNNSSLFQATATLASRTGPDSDLYLKANGSGGIQVSNVVIQNGKALIIQGANNTAINGTITQSGTGNASFTKYDAGTLTLAGTNANTLSGASTVNAGTLVLNKSANVAAIAGALTISSGATLRTDAANQLNSQLVTVNGAFNMNGQNQTFALAGSGTVTNNAILTNNSTGTDTFSGVMSGTGAMVKANAGTNIFSGNNTYTGGTTISAGALQLGAGGTSGTVTGNMTNNATLIFNRSGAFNFTNLISGSGVVTINGGTITLGNTNNSFTGNININNGATLAIQQWGTNASGVASTGNHSQSITATTGSSSWMVINGGTAQYVGAGETFGGGITVGTLGATIDASGTGSLNLNKNSGGLLLTGDQSTARVLTITGTNTGANTLNWNLTNGSAGAVVSVSKTGTGTWRLSGTGAFSGGVDVRQGTIEIGAVSQLSSFGSGTIRIYDGATFKNSGTTPRGTFTNSFNLGGTNNLDQVVIGAATTLTNDTVLNITLTNNTGVEFTSAGIIGESGGSRSLRKTGVGTLTLNSANTYSGGTTLSVGSLNVTNSGTLGSASSAVTVSGGTLDLGAAARTNGTVTVSGGTLQNGTLSSTTLNITGGTIANTVTNSATTVNLSGGTLGTSSLSASSAFNYGGGVTGISTVVLGGAGRFNLTNSTLTLSDNFNTLTGGIGLTGGTLTLTNASNLGAGSFLLGSAGTLGTLQVNNTTTATNAFVVNDLSTNTSINVASGQTFTMSGTISQTNGANNTTKFGKDGAGTLVMAGANGTYGGQLQIGQGTVIVGLNNALGTNVTTSARGVDLGLNVGDTAMTNNVALLLSNGVTFGQSIYVATNASSATRTLGLSGTGAAGSFTNEIYQHGDLILDAGSSTGVMTVSGVIKTNDQAVAMGITIQNGTTLLSGNNSYTGRTTISSGTLRVGNTGAMGAGSTDQSVGTWLSGGNLDLNGMNLGSSTETIVMSSSASYITNSSTTTAILGGTIFLTNSTANTFAVDSGKDINLTGSITNGSASRVLVKSGSGTLTMSGSNTNNGQINVTGGTLKIGHVAALGNGTTTSNIAVSAGATLDLNGYTVASLRTITNAGGTLANSAAGAATFSNAINMTADSSYNATGNMTLSGPISGAFAFTKTGAGTVSLSGTNTYSGGTVVNNGVLAIAANNNAISSGALTLSGGTLQTTGTSMDFSVGAVTFGGSGELQLAANGKLVSTGVVTVDGAS
ncbi:MAG: hypothetical protein EBS53_07835, partial [Bacteroidetes bacterium]|nr:hypothetical protein [Bacteroidota bacterium]